MSILEVSDLSAGYGVIPVLRDISFSVPPGVVYAIIGANGAGKTTTLRALSGLLGKYTGTVRFAGERIDGYRPERIVEAGMAQVPEGRLLFPKLTVRENLEMGAYLPAPRKAMNSSLEMVFDLFPVLKERQLSPAGSLSGGQQQMVAVGRALMTMPKLLILDEPSTGLAPKIVDDVLNVVKKLASRGLSIVLVEQNVTATLEMASSGHVLENGRITLRGSGAELLSNPAIRSSYLGL